MPVKKVKKTKVVEEPKEVDTPVLNDLEFNRPADRLIEAIRQYFQKIHGVNPTAEVTEKEIGKIIRSRLYD